VSVRGLCLRAAASRIGKRFDMPVVVVGRGVAQTIRRVDGLLEPERTRRLSSPTGARTEPPSSETEQFQDRVAEILRKIEAEHGASSDALLSDLRRSLEQRPVSMDWFRCSFCSEHRSEVLKLISGPRVFICDRCVGDAAAILTHVLQTA
jgi:ClpX C4-type zinc finger protein